MFSHWNIKKIVSTVISILLLSTRYAPEATIIDLHNNSKEELILLSNTELEDYKTAFLAKEIIEERTISKSTHKYIGLYSYDLHNFLHNNKRYLFYFLIHGVKGNADKIDSLVINKNCLKVLNANNCLYYQDNKIVFANVK